MEKNVKPKNLPYRILALGTLALVLRKLLYLVAVDEKGLLVRSHPLEWALAALSAAVLVLIVAAVWKLDGSNVYTDNFFPSVPAAVGHWLAAAGILLTMLGSEPVMEGYLGNFWQGLGWLSPVCLLAAGFARLRGKQPFFGLQLVPCLFVVFHIVCHYRIWCGDPQLQNYVFALFGGIALLLTWFHTAAFAAGVGKRRMQLGISLTAVYLCMAELALSQYPLLYAVGAAFALTNLCSLEPRPKPDSGPAENEA